MWWRWLWWLLLLLSSPLTTLSQWVGGEDTPRVPAQLRGAVRAYVETYRRYYNMMTEEPLQSNLEPASENVLAQEIQSANTTLAAEMRPRACLRYWAQWGWSDSNAPASVVADEEQMRSKESSSDELRHPYSVGVEGSGHHVFSAIMHNMFGNSADSTFPGITTY